MTKGSNNKSHMGHTAILIRAFLFQKEKEMKIKSRSTHLYECILLLLLAVLFAGT